MTCRRVLRSSPRVVIFCVTTLLLPLVVPTDLTRPKDDAIMVLILIDLWIIWVVLLCEWCTASRRTLVAVVVSATVSSFAG